MNPAGALNLLEQGEIFICADDSGGINNLIGFAIAEPGDGTCNITIEKIRSEPLPLLDRMVKGTFTVAITDAGTTYRFTGSFQSRLVT